MDPISQLVSGLMTVLMPYPVKDSQQFARTVGEAAYSQAKLADLLKEGLGGNEEASESLEHFEQKPERHSFLNLDIRLLKVYRQLLLFNRC